MSEFTYFVCLESNIDLLKEEIKHFAPELRLSFSKGNFLTFKGAAPIAYEFAFALDWGKSESLSSEYIQQKLAICHKIPDLPEQAPSRAYLKLKQACDYYHISNPHFKWVEFGCSPGGAIYYLTQNFKHVVGIDPARVDKTLKGVKNFKHIKLPVQNITQDHFSRFDVDYFTSDLNLNPHQAIAEVLRCSEYFPNLKGIFMTIKMVKNEHVSLIPKFIKSFKNAGFDKIHKKQLSSHKREFLLYASK